MRALALACVLATLAACAASDTQQSDEPETKLELKTVRYNLGGPLVGAKLEGPAGTYVVEGVQKDKDTPGPLTVVKGESAAAISGVLSAADIVVKRDGDVVTRKTPKRLHGALALLPALLAIILALVTRQVLLSLMGGVLFGVALLTQSPLGSFTGSLDLLVNTAADPSKLKVILFTLGMGVVAASGGSKGIVKWVSSLANTPRMGALSAWLMGMVVFFDDYASTLLVGSTMRPISDSLKMSREKLSYIVDSTAAPIASIALVSTWIGYEVSTMDTALVAAGLKIDAYQLFYTGIPARFYPIYALLFVAIVAITRRDFGPMLTAEVRARKGAVMRPGAKPLMDAALVEDQEKLEAAEPRPWLAVIPVVSLIGLVLIGLAVLGADASYDALLYASAGSCAIAVVFAMATGALNLSESIEALLSGVRAMVLAIFVLILAWALSKVMGDLRAGDYVATLIGDVLPVWTLPTLTFVLAAVIALCTGTSWGTMGVLFPIAIPVAAAHAAALGEPAFMDLLVGITSAVLAGAVFGDHCSPISDTTVLSSIACASDHVDHTRTQAPYAILCAIVAIVFGILPASFGVPALVMLPIGVSVLVGALFVLGKSADDLSDTPKMGDL